MLAIGVYIREETGSAFVFSKEKLHQLRGLTYVWNSPVKRLSPVLITLVRVRSGRSWTLHLFRLRKRRLWRLCPLGQIIASSLAICMVAFLLPWRSRWPRWAAR